MGLLAKPAPQDPLQDFRNMRALPSETLAIDRFLASMPRLGFFLNRCRVAKDPFAPSPGAASSSSGQLLSGSCVA